MNKAIVCGNLGSAPEIRYTGSGTPVTELSVATNRKWKSKDGTPQEETEWHRVTVWSKQAEHCVEKLGKGSKVLVEGRLKTEKWSDKDGNARYTTKIVAHRVDFLGAAGRGDGEAPPSENQSSFRNDTDFSDDDIPF